MAPTDPNVPPVDPEQTLVLGLLHRYGWNALSFQILEPGFLYWFHGEDACVGYVDTGKAWVVAGAPIAPPERLHDVAAAFSALASRRGRRVAFFGTEPRFLDAAPRWHALRVGEQPVWAPEEWSATLERSRSLREQLRRARAKGVQVRKLDPTELLPGHATRHRLDTLIARWLHTRPMAPMGFLVQIHPYTFPEQRHCFVAEREGRMVGFLGVIPVFARGGWFFEDFLSDPDAPNGTVDLLIDAGMRAAASARIPYVTLGLVPLAGRVGARFRAARRWGSLLYDFNGLYAFKSKFRPRVWDPIHLSYPPGGSSWAAIGDTLTAFSRGGLLSFGAQTLLRGPMVVLRVLALLLVPWTLLLALPMSRDWFPSEPIRWAWIGFDVAVAVALYRLSERWDQRLARILTGAVALDAILTVVQALLYDLPAYGDLTGILVILTAVLAPTMAAALLWRGGVHRRGARGDMK